VVFDTRGPFLGAATAPFGCDLGCRPAAQGVILALPWVKRDPLPPQNQVTNSCLNSTELPTEKTEAGLPANRERNHDRRQFVAGASVGVAGAVSVYTEARDWRKARASSRWSPSGRRACPASNRAPIVSRNRSPRCRADGLQVKVFPAGQLVGCHGIVRCRLFRPRRHVACLGNHLGWPVRRVLPTFANVPFGITAPEINAWIYHGRRPGAVG